MNSKIIVQPTLMASSLSAFNLTNPSIPATCKIFLRSPMKQSIATKNITTTFSKNSSGLKTALSFLLPKSHQANSFFMKKKHSRKKKWQINQNIISENSRTCTKNFYRRKATMMKKRRNWKKSFILSTIKQAMKRRKWQWKIWWSCFCRDQLSLRR